MKEYIILSRCDMLALCDDKPVTIYINKKPYELCTDEYFEKQIRSSKADKEQSKWGMEHDIINNNSGI